MAKRSLRNQIFVLIIIAIVVEAIAAGICTTYLLKGYAEEGVKTKVKGDVALTEALIDALYPGPWEVKNGRLYKGGTLMNGNPVVNTVTRLTGDTCTIFLGDVVIATTVPGPSGKPETAARVPEPVRKTVLNEGQPYYGSAALAGKPYQTAYLPLRNANGEVVGILYVGTPQTLIHRTVHKLILGKAVVVLILLAILGLLITFAFAKWLSPLRSISKILKAVARGEYDRALEPARYVEFEGIVEAAERMRLDIKNTFDRLNDLSSFGMRAVSLIKEDEAYKLLIHYLKRLGVDETIIVLIDEGHRRGKVVAYYCRQTREEEYLDGPSPRFNFAALKAVEACQAVRTLSPCIVDKQASDLGCRNPCEVWPQTNSYVCYPMAVAGRSLGWVKVASNNTGFFHPEIRRSIEGYVSITAAMVSNLRLSELNKLLSLTDPLTKLYNCRFLEEYFEIQIAEANRRQEPFAVVFLDIDQFKFINDTYGHEAGDKVLAAVARTIRESLRQVDLMVRYGGEEFVIVLPGTNLDGGITVAEKIRRTVAATPIRLESGETIYLTVSLGVTRYTPGTLSTSAEMIQQADEAMYQAKLKGKNQVVVWKGNGTDTENSQSPNPA
ncbi:MAG: diguanylate cyclase [Firmicutes bacterium]|nr:diguanylate cyclase [Bacillota bacterium]